jgi:hypothetical protein
MIHPEPLPIGKRSLERLAHFNCGKCGGWWSIGDAPVGRAYCCPWCGKWQQFSDTPTPGAEEAG